MSCSSTHPPTYCSAASPELKLYQACIFSVPVFFTFVLLLLFYLFYLRRRRANWQSLRMRATHLVRGEISLPLEAGIKKEVREMLPVVVFKESFLIRETQCSVCLGDYQSDERLQRIPPCGHTFHVDCIDHWLATNTTCPLCRVSLLPAAKATTDSLNYEGQAIRGEDFEEQSSERRIHERSVQHEAGDGEGDSTFESLACGSIEVKHGGEGSVVIDVDSHGITEGNIRS